MARDVFDLTTRLKKRDGKGVAISGIVLNTLGLGLEVWFILYILSAMQ